LPKSKQEINSKDSLGLGHALFFAGDFKKDADFVIKYFSQDLEFGISGNPDILSFFNEKLSVEAAREIRSYANMLPVKEKQIHIIVGFGSATLEAQNALLKAVEEPGSATKFYIIAPSLKSLIPTLQSRLIEVENSNEKEEIFEKEVKKFFASSSGGRIKIVEKIADDLKNEKVSKADIHIFLKKIKNEALKDYKKNTDLLSNIAVAEKYLESSSSVKQILSLVALC
jgi:DNA polymerase III gamma/tau subunit